MHRILPLTFRTEDLSVYQLSLIFQKKIINVAEEVTLLVTPGISNF